MRTYDLPEFRFPPDAMQFSPNGRLLAIQSLGQVAALDTTTGKTWFICPENVGSAGTAGVGFTADNRGVVYFNTRTKGVHVFNLERGRDQVLRAGNTVHWSRRGDIEICTTRLDGKLAFVAVNPLSRQVEIVAMDPITGMELFSFARHGSFIRELAVSPEGDWVAACSVKELRVWGIGGGKRPKRAGWHLEDLNRGCFGNLALSRDGAYLAAGGYRSSSLIGAWDLLAKTELKPPDGLRGEGWLAFAPDRPVLAIPRRVDGRGEVVFWEVRAGAEPRAFDWGIGPVGAVAFSPDGFRCATAGQSKAVVWDVDA